MQFRSFVSRAEVLCSQRGFSRRATFLFRDALSSASPWSPPPYVVIPTGVKRSDGIRCLPTRRCLLSSFRPERSEVEESAVCPMCRCLLLSFRPERSGVTESTVCQRAAAYCRHSDRSEAKWRSPLFAPCAAAYCRHSDRSEAKWRNLLFAPCATKSQGFSLNLGRVSTKRC